MTRWIPGLSHYSHPNPEFLRGLGAIADYLKTSVDTVRALIYHEGLPALQLPNGNWFTSKKCLIAWSLSKDDPDLAKIREARDKMIAEEVEREAKEILEKASQIRAA